MKEYSIICETCLKFAHVERVELDGLHDMILVECHGVTRLAQIWTARHGDGPVIKRLWSQVDSWFGPQDAIPQIEQCQAQIDKYRRLIEFWRRLK